MKQSKLPKQTLIILGIALVLVISTVMWSSAQITQDTEEEVQSTLRDVATQNALIVQQELRENFNLLYSLADAISVSPDAVNAKSIAAQLGSFVSTYEFKRIGFVSPDGQVISTDGYVQDLSSRDFFKDGMQGLPGITNTLQDRLGTPEPINVFSIPVYDQSDSIIGVLFAMVSVAFLALALSDLFCLGKPFPKNHTIFRKCCTLTKLSLTYSIENI